MTEWPTMTLRDAGIILIDCVHKTPPAIEVGYPYVTIPQMKDGRIDLDGARRISHADFLEWTKKARPQVHDVVLSRRTNPGVTATFGENCEFALGQNLVLLRANGSLVCPEFLRWLVVSPAWWSQIEKYNNVGAVFDSLKCADVPRFELPIPPKHEQRAIASILRALDDKIELNRRMNDTLETMARAIFGEMQNNQEWHEFSLGDVCEIFDGPHATPRLVEAGPVFLGISNLDNGRVNLHETSHVSIEDFKRWTRRVTPRAGDVVFSYETRLGQVALIPSELTCCLGRRMGLLRVKAGCSSVLLLQAYLAPPFQETIRQRTVHGSTVDRLPLKDMHAFPILLPRGSDATNLSAILEPFRSKIDANDRNSRTLAKTRDLLLPKLISGEIGIKSLEMVVEAVL